MVAVGSSNTYKYLYSVSLSTSSGTIRQSSLRSVTSTHSRRSLIKEELDEISDNNCIKRRVRFSCDIDVTDGADSLRPESVYEYLLPVDNPIEPLYLTASEIEKIRSDARNQALHFAQVYPSIVAEINDVFQNGGNCMNRLSQIERLRRRRRRFDPFEVALKSSDRDEDVFCHDNDECLLGNDQNEPNDDSDENIDETHYFCTMRGLENRMSRMFRLNRRLSIKSVINLQSEMKKSGCCPAQVQMGLRAVSAQSSQKTRDFAIYQAALDELELCNI